MNSTRTKLLLANLLLGSAIFFSFCMDADAAQKRRIVLKNRIIPRGPVVRLGDAVANPAVLTEAEKQLEVTEAPTKSDETVKLMDIAYMLQRHASLLDANLSGPRRITIQRIVDSKMMDRFKDKIISAIKKLEPWKDWEIDIILSPSDETVITRAGDFDNVEILPSDNRNMLGVVNLNIGFLDAKGRQVGKSSINPTILKKMNVAILNTNCKQGEILTKSHIRETAMWLGPEARNYVNSAAECYGRELAKSMPAGEILRTNDVLNPVCAKKGDMIQVECRSGALSVKISGLAMDTGRMGDSIRVVNQTSQKTLNVELTGDKTGIIAAIGG